MENPTITVQQFYAHTARENTRPMLFFINSKTIMHKYLYPTTLVSNNCIIKSPNVNHQQQQ